MLNSVDMPEGFEEVSISIETAGKRVSRYVLPSLVIFNLPYLLLHGFKGYGGITLTASGWFLLIFISGVIIHELIHALIFGLLCRDGFRSISFGIDKATLSPYCYCNSNLRVWAYRTGALMPFFVLGVVPLIISWFTASVGFLIFGSLFSVFSGGDWVAVTLTKGLNSRDIVKDHPAKLGFYIVKRDAF
ncbi:DUF3267 domain-containing protein [Alkaliflexus imshenetskii]|uniref:DUF3267 domain-containing protein n=1 Tax=Alkaliflexus imshenetskii TaxID=286730 RepID=UPI0004B31B27|nr:DUF3267 domain-containing protein [Alkaliflexus imshenetskii]